MSETEKLLEEKKELAGAENELTGAENELAGAEKEIVGAEKELTGAEKEIAGANEGEFNSLAATFTDLPLGLLICQPIIEVAKGQAALCNVYLETLMKLAYTEDSTKENRKTNIISFEYDKVVVDKVTGQVGLKKYKINAPLLSLVPVPAFTMEEATVAFTMEVNQMSNNVDTNESELTSDVKLSFWGQTAQIGGRVAAKSEHTRQTDSHAKYELHARAVQQAPAEGMAKLTDLLASTIEPIELTN